MTSVSIYVYIDKLDDMVNKYNNTYHSTIEMKSVDVKSSTYIDFGIENNNKNSKFKVGDHEKISKYKSIFAKVYVPIGVKNCLWLKILIILFCGRM